MSALITFSVIGIAEVKCISATAVCVCVCVCVCLSVCLTVPRRIPTLLMDPDVT